MAIAPDGQRHRLRGVELLQQAPPAPASPLSECLNRLHQDWRRDGSLAGLWQDWPSIAGERLATHCRPLFLHRGVLTVGASHPQWRQALQYNKPQLISALNSAGHPVKDLRIQQHHAGSKAPLESEKDIWSRHPSRTDVHGMGTCPQCQRPAPNGEMQLWNCCGFCHRQRLSDA